MHKKIPKPLKKVFVKNTKSKPFDISHLWQGLNSANAASSLNKNIPTYWRAPTSPDEHIEIPEACHMKSFVPCMNTPPGTLQKFGTGDNQQAFILHYGDVPSPPPSC